MRVIVPEEERELFLDVLAMLHNLAKGAESKETIKTYKIAKNGTKKLLEVKEIQSTMQPNETIKAFLAVNPEIRQLIDEMIAEGRLSN